MRAGHIRNLAALIGVVAMAGCKVGPNYKAPAMPAPPAYSDDGHNGAWTTATPADTADRGNWWAVYGDTELNNLEQRCATANQSIAAAMQAYQQAHDLVRESRASLYPTIAIGVAANRNRISSTRPLRPSNAAQDYWDFLIPLNISWEPDLWGRVRRQIESNSAEAQATAAEVANTRLSLQGLLATSFFELRGIDLQAQLLQSTLGAYEQALKLTEDRFRGGLSTESDVDQAKTQLEQTRAQMIDLGVGRAQLEHAIAVLVGAPATGFHIAEKPLAGYPPSVPTGIPSELLQRRPDIAASERRVAAANAVIGVAKSAYYPTIVLGAGGTIESSQITNLFNQGSAGWNAGVNASELLFDAGRRRAQVDYALAQREQATALYRDQVLSAFRDVEDQLSALRILEQEASVQNAAVQASKRSTELSTLRYKRGLAPYLEVLTNQTIELTNERVAASLVTQRILASTRLQIALGGGWSSAQLPPD